jgi:hypothetical protein
MTKAFIVSVACPSIGFHYLSGFMRRLPSAVSGLTYWLDAARGPKKKCVIPVSYPGRAPFPRNTWWRGGWQPVRPGLLKVGETAFSPGAHATPLDEGACRQMGYQ